MTANFVAGYELGQWTGGANSTIGSSVQNPTTIMVMGDSTVTLTAQEIPSYTVTVNLDAHSMSVTFSNSEYGTQNVVNTDSNGDGTHTGSVSLRKGVVYDISGTFDDENYYAFNSWATTGNGTLESASNSATTYVITDTATLSLTSKLKTGATTLLPGQELNAKIKTLAEGTSKHYYDSSSKIKALKMADSLPAGFTPSTTNTVSIDGSEKPVYIFFDNTNDAGIMYFYTEARDIYINQNSNSAFFYNRALTNISAVSNWNTSNVTNMSSMFNSTTSLTNIDALANWDTSNVTNMSSMFNSTTSLTNIDALANWDTSNVTNMSEMFSYVGNNLFYLNASALNNWDVRNVKATAGDYDTDSGFYRMFAGVGGRNHPTFSKRSGTWHYDNTGSEGSLYDGTFVPNNTTSTTVTVTVNFDSHISNVKIDNNTVTISGGTVSLTRGSSHTITATLASGYEVALWNPRANGVISSRDLTLNELTFIPTGDTTLSVTSQPIPDDVTTTVNMDSHISNIKFCNNKYASDCIIASENGRTVTLKQGATYRVTTNVKPGYEVSSWITVGGTVSNNAGTHTNFTPNGTSSISVTSTTATPTHTVTVNMDSNISYVTFTNADWPTRVAIRNEFEVELRENTPYVATAYTKNGYILSSWTTTTDGILSSTSTNPTTYIVTGTSTLSITSQQPTSPAQSPTSPEDNTPSSNTNPLTALNNITNTAESTPSSSTTTTHTNNAAANDPEDTADPTPGSTNTYTTPQGVTESTNTTTDSSLATSLLIGTATSATSGVVLLFLAHRRHNDEDNENTPIATN